MLAGTRCALRPLVVADASSLAAHANDREIWLNLRDRFPHPYAVKDALAFIALLATAPHVTTFGIVVEKDVVGSIGLRPGDDIERCSAEVGYWIGRAFWNRGIVSDALRLITRYAFDHLAMSRVYALPFVRNAASSRVLDKVGFSLEGHLRKSAVKDGVLLDQWVYAACADTWVR
jgi:[ribosomal protein S5]-alanine N-acetyltransferase